MRHLDRLKQARCSRGKFLAHGGIILAVAPAMLLLGGRTAKADCTPAAADNVIATCSGLTNNQGSGAPGTSLGSAGYGSGT